MYTKGHSKLKRHNRYRSTRWTLLFTGLLVLCAFVYCLRANSGSNITSPTDALRSVHGVAYPRERFDEHVNISGTLYRYTFPLGMFSSNAILYGILTMSRTKPLRDAIRQSWGFNSDIYFICAGQWEDIVEEDSEHHDMIWLDAKEAYNDNGYSVLPIKSQVLIHVFQKHSPSQWLVKTDDDSYIFTAKLERLLSKTLLHSTEETLNTFTERLGKSAADRDFFSKDLNYYGRRHATSVPIRDPRHQWYVPVARYSANKFPAYAAGAGYVVSKQFANCAVGHLASIRHMPMEDVMTGMLADLCHIELLDAGHAIQESDHDIVAWHEKDMILRHHVKTPILMKALWNSEKITGTPRTNGLFRRGEDAMKVRKNDRPDYRIPRMPFCDRHSPIFLRSGFLDYRTRDGQHNAVIVMMAELEKTYDVDKISGCLVTSINGAFIATGSARVVPIQLDSDTGYSWIRGQFPFLTHRQVFVQCIVDMNAVPETKYRDMQTNMKVALYRTEHGRECEEQQETQVIAVIPSERPQQSTLEICVAVFRPTAAQGYPVRDMIHHWLTHYKQFDVSRVNIYVDGMQSLRDSTLYSELDKKALNDALVGFIDWAPQVPIESPLWHGQGTERIEIGDGKTFYWSQGLAYNDCIYTAASRGSKVLLVDFDEFVTGLPNDALTFTEDALSFAWILHHTECPTDVFGTGNDIWKWFERNGNNWRAGPKHVFEGGLNGKSIHNSWNILDSGVHQPNHCIRDPCTFPRINNLETGIYIAHVRRGKLEGYDCNE